MIQIETKAGVTLHDFHPDFSPDSQSASESELAGSGLQIFGSVEVGSWSESRVMFEGPPDL